MEKTKTLTLFFCMFMIGGTSAANDKQLVAPEPPRGIEAPELNIGEFNNGSDAVFVRAFHSPLLPSEVASFYEDHLGSMTLLEEGNHYRADLLEIGLKSTGVLKVYALPRNPGVSVKHIRSLQPRHCTSEYFRAFRDMSRQLEKYSRRDYNDICSRYGYLEYGYYGYTEKRGVDGRQLTKDQVLFRDYASRLDPEASKQHDAEALTAEAQRLIMQGKIDEAQVLFEEISKLQQHNLDSQMQRIQDMEQKEVEDNWDQWVEFLEALDEMVYPTAVFIDVHPSDWPDDEWLKDNIEW